MIEECLRLTRFPRARRGLEVVFTGAVLLAIVAFTAGAQTSGSGERAGAGEAGGASGSREITLDLIYGDPLLEPLPGAYTWSPDGKTLLFVTSRGEGDEKRKTLHALDLGTGTRRVVLGEEEYEELIGDGRHGAQRPSGRGGYSGFELDPEGRRFLLVRDGDLHLIDLVEKKSRQLTASKGQERHPQFSPDGKKISYVRDHDVFVYDLERGLERQITDEGREGFTFGESDWVYDEELDLHGGLWWSPRSTHIALLHFDEAEVPGIPIVDFVPVHKKVRMQRYPKAGDPNPKVSLHLVNLEEEEKPRAKEEDGEGIEEEGEEELEGQRGLREVELPDVGDGYLARVEFLPDGSKMILQLLNRQQDELRLLLCDVESGKTTALFTEKSPWWINVHDDLRVLKSGEILWASERDGWNHLYLYRGDGKLIRQLTVGSWVVTGLAGVDEDAGRVYFTATREGPGERHLYGIDLSGGGLTRITKEAGYHGINMSEDARFFVDSFSAADRLPRVDLYRTSGERVVTLGESSAEKIEELALGGMEFLTVPTKDGLTLPGFLIKPHDFDPSVRYPVLFYVYGGPQSQTVRNRWGGNRYLWHQMLANRGILVFSMDNRASLGMGLASASVIYGNLGKTELDDLLEGVRHLSTLPYVDPERLGIWGWSYGGTMASYSILNAPETFKVAVAVAPVTDWKNYDTIYTERYMDRPQDNPDGYESASVVAKAGELQGHLLVSHGTADDNVHFQNAVQLAKALIDEGKNFEFLMYPGGKHGIGGKKVQKQMFTAITDFLLEHLLGDAGRGPAATSASRVEGGAAGEGDAAASDPPAPRKESR